MWQNKIEILWQSIQESATQSVACEQFDPISSRSTIKTYSNFLQDLNTLNAFLKDKSELKIALVMEKSYYSFLSVVFCLLRGHCFMPALATSKTLQSSVKMFSPDFIFTCNKLAWADFPNAINLDQVLKQTSAALPLKPAELNPNQTAYVISTSGTTGQPKLIPISFKNFDAYLSNILPQVKSAASFTLYQNFEISFDPYLFDIVSAVINKSTLAPISHSNLRHFQKIASQNAKDAWISLTPSQGDLLLSFLKGTTFPQLKKTFFLGEKLKTNLCKNWLLVFPNSEIYNMYGPAETTVSIFTHRFDPSTDDKIFVPIGQIHQGHDFKIENTKELFVRGDQVFNGYVNMAENNSLNQGWYNTHDTVEIFDSKIYVLGRADFQVKINGRRIQPEEIEMTLSSLGYTGYLIPITQETTHSAKTQFVLATINKSLTLDSIRDALLEQFEIDFLPKQVFYVDAYPLSQNGKVDRNQLKEFYLTTKT